MIILYEFMQSWQSGLLRQPAKLLIALGWSDGSNPSGCVSKVHYSKFIKLLKLMNLAEIFNWFKGRSKILNFLTYWGFLFITFSIFVPYSFKR